MSSKYLDNDLSGSDSEEETSTLTHDNSFSVTKNRSGKNQIKNGDHDFTMNAAGLTSAVESDLQESENEEDELSRFVGGSKKLLKQVKQKRFNAFKEQIDDIDDEDKREMIVGERTAFSEIAEKRSIDGEEDIGNNRKKQKIETEQGKDLLDKDSLSQLNKESTLYQNIKREKLSKEKLEKIEKKLKKTGVVYISKVPPYMKTSKMRQILEKFGKVDRLFLKPESHAQYVKRVKLGSNKKKMFTEGWAEFLNKKDAKLFVDTMNGQKIGGKKNNFYYDDILNLKYLRNFKWIDLTSQMAKENEAKQSKLMLEISRATKLNNAFISNVEKSKMVNNIRNKKKLRGELLEDD